MNKTKIILICVGVLVVVSLLTYLNYDKILTYFTNKEWEVADSVGRIELTNYLTTCGTSSNFLVFNNEGVRGYSNVVKENFNKDITFKDIIAYSESDYAIVAEKDSSNIYVISGNNIVWNASINNANILGVYINKNGYASVIYSQTGYKSLVKVFTNTGEELFTNYFASTYAIDVAISNDNKTLAIAEIDTNGIAVKSRVKLIDIKDLAENNVKKYDLDSNELITDVEFNENNDLIIMSDMSVKIFENGSFDNIVKFSDDNIFCANITNKKNIVTVKNEKEGLFNVSSQICIYDYDLTKEPNIYELDDTPNSIICNKNVIAVDMGDEIIFLNSSGKFMKKSEYNGQLRDINLFDDGNMAVLIFRDMAEFVKVGGI